jgi:hypothetical protein
MAIHYMMRDKKAFGTFMDAVAGALKRGGVFAGTLMNGDRLERILDSTGGFESGLMKVKREGEEVAVSMKETYYFERGASNEPLVRPEKLIDAALERGLRLVSWNNFPCYMRVPAKYPREAVEVLSLYDVFIFFKPVLR